MTVQDQDIRTEEELKRQLFYLQALHDVGREMAPLQDVRTILEVSAMSVAGTMGASMALVLLQEGESPQAETVFAMGLEPDARAALENLIPEHTGEAVRMLVGCCSSSLDRELSRVAE